MKKIKHILPAIVLVLILSFAVFLPDVQTYAEAVDGQDSAETTECVLFHRWAPATCTEPKTCKRCGATKGEPKGHQFEDWNVQVEPTCRGDGARTRICSRCGKQEVEILDALGHDYTPWSVLREADCTHSGTQMRTCMRCGITFIEDIPRLDHQPGTRWKDCGFDDESERGLATINCENCGEVLYSIHYNPVYAGLSSETEKENQIGGYTVFGSLLAEEQGMCIPIMQTNSIGAMEVGPCLMSETNKTAKNYQWILVTKYNYEFNDLLAGLQRDDNLKITLVDGASHTYAVSLVEQITAEDSKSLSSDAYNLQIMIPLNATEFTLISCKKIA